MYPRNLPQPADHPLQVFHVLNINHNIDRCLAVGGAGFNVADVCIVVGNHGGQLLQHRRTVIAKNCQLYWIHSASVCLVHFERLGPFHCNTAISLIHQVVDVGAAYRVHGHAFAARHVAHNRFTANRIATSRAIHQQIVIAFYLDRACVRALAKHATDHRAQRAAGLRRFFRSGRLLGNFR